MERVLTALLKEPFTKWLPIQEEVDRRYFAMYCLARKAVGAKRPQIL